MMLRFHTVWEIIWWDFLVFYWFLFEPLIRAGSDFFFFFSFLLSPEALGILVPHLGVKPILLQWKRRALTIGLPGTLICSGRRKDVENHKGLHTF